MKRIIWSDWLLILVVLGFLAFVVMQVSCVQSAYAKRNRCVRKYLNYYTSGTEVTEEGGLSATGISERESQKTTGFDPEVQAGVGDVDTTFQRIAALCLLDDDDLVQYIFETEYEPKEE